MLRIVAGKLGGRRFAGPLSDATRPTSDRVREALSSALDSRGLLAGAVVLDLFAGTGALAFEALSRGAGAAVLVERDRRAASSIEKSAASLGLGGVTTIVCADAFAPTLARRLAAKGPFTLVFADPPYALADRVPALFASLTEVIADGAVLVLEHATNQPPPVPGLPEIARYAYGDTSLMLLRRGES